MNIRQLWRRAGIVLVTVLTAAGASLSMSGTALAFDPICTLNGQQLCIDSSNVSDGTAVTGDLPGRLMVKQDQGFTHNGYEVYRMAFHDNTARCVGLTSDTFKPIIRDCSGGNSNYTNWQRIPQPGGWVQWQNNSAPGERALASDNHWGDRLVTCVGTCGGVYYTWKD